MTAYTSVREPDGLTYVLVDGEKSKAPRHFDPPAVDTIPADTADEYVCPECGNRTDTDGFYAVSPDGYWVEPTPAWDGIYACADCGRRSRIT